MTPGYQAILGAVAQGHAADIDGNPAFRIEWIKDEEVRTVVSAAVSLAREKKTFNLLNVMARARSVDWKSRTDIVQALQNGHGADWEEALNAVKAEWMLSEAAGIRDDLEGFIQNKPGEVERWMPIVTTRLNGTVRAGVSYDPRPSTHMKRPMPQICAYSMIKGMNALLRGGYRSSLMLLYAGLSKHGKSTTLYSHAVDLLRQKKRISLIVTENSEQVPVARIAMAMGGLTMEEIEKKVFQTPEREARYCRVMAFLEEHLRVYGWDWMSTDRIRRIKAWDDSDAIIIDYLKNQTGMFGTKSNPSDPVGEMANFLKNEITVSGRPVMVLTAGQIAGKTAQDIQRGKHEHEPAPLYGSALPGYAADEYVLLRRSPTAKDVARFRVWLDRWKGDLDTVHEIPLDVPRKTLAFMGQEMKDEPDVLQRDLPNMPTDSPTDDG